MDRLTEETLEELAMQKLQGDSYSVIRERLVEMGLSKEEIRDTIRLVDERVLRAEVEQGRQQRARSWYRVGLVLAVAGLIISIGSNSGLILSGIPRWLVYSPFFAGILMMTYGRLQQRKASAGGMERPGRIRNRRPYK